jgi:hypothetical protein
MRHDDGDDGAATEVIVSLLQRLLANDECAVLTPLRALLVERKARQKLKEEEAACGRPQHAPERRECAWLADSNGRMQRTYSPSFHLPPSSRV